MYTITRWFSSCTRTYRVRRILSPESARPGRVSSSAVHRGWHWRNHRSSQQRGMGPASKAQNARALASNVIVKGGASQARRRQPQHGNQERCRLACEARQWKRARQTPSSRLQALAATMLTCRHQRGAATRSREPGCRSHCRMQRGCCLHGGRRSRTRPE